MRRRSPPFVATTVKVALPAPSESVGSLCNSFEQSAALFGAFAHWRRITLAPGVKPLHVTVRIWPSTSPTPGSTCTTGVPEARAVAAAVIERPAVRTANRATTRQAAPIFFREFGAFNAFTSLTVTRETRSGQPLSVDNFCCSPSRVSAFVYCITKGFFVG